METENKFHLNVLIPVELKEELAEFAYDHGFLNLSECIRYIFRMFLKDVEKEN